MAITTGLTLAQYASLSNDPLIRGITLSLMDSGSVMARDIPMVTNKTLYVNGARFAGDLPTINWRALNEEGSHVTMVPTPFQEQVYILANYVDIDRYLVEDQNAIRDVRATQTDAVLKAVATDFNDKFLNNNHTSGDVDAPVGLKYRIANGTTYGVNSENLIDAGGTAADMSSITAATASAFLEKLDELLFVVDAPDGSPNVVLYCNEVLKRRMNRAVRQLGAGGGFDTSRDQYDRTVDTYKGCPIRDIGRKLDQSELIITNTELATGLADTGSTFTSIYAVNYGDGHFGGWQFDPLGADNLGLLNNGVQYRTFISWAGGLINYSTRSIARLFDIKMS
jgi:Major capsid protein GP7